MDIVLHPGELALQAEGPVLKTPPPPFLTPLLRQACNRDLLSRAPPSAKVLLPDDRAHAALWSLSLRAGGPQQSHHASRPHTNPPQDLRTEGGLQCWWHQTPVVMTDNMLMPDCRRGQISSVHLPPCLCLAGLVHALSTGMPEIWLSSYGTEGSCETLQSRGSLTSCQAQPLDSMMAAWQSAPLYKHWLGPAGLDIELVCLFPACAACKCWKPLRQVWQCLWQGLLGLAIMAALAACAGQLLSRPDS